MCEQDTPEDEPMTPCRDAVDVSDFVFAATGARVRRLTLPDGAHWFPAVDVAENLGYANTRQALQWHVSPDCRQSLGDLARGVYGADASRRIAGHGLKKSMKMVTLAGLIQLVNGCTKQECAPFRRWVADVVATVQRDGAYELVPAPVQPAHELRTAYVMPEEIVDALVRLEERSIRAAEACAAREEERHLLLREASRGQDLLTQAFHRIADSLDRLAERAQPGTSAGPGVSTGPGVSAGSGATAAAGTPQELLARWQDRNLVITEDVRTVAAVLAPGLVAGAARCSTEEIAGRTGLSPARVQDCVRHLLRRGCIRQSGCAPDGAPVYVLV
ncbi:DNA-binding protein [Streptomyces sp. SID10853]|uniref:BRO family protein n=1 Tax=Streptomyces sp. SID10853 TaxID=2706028 RepID=UPI0013BF64E2|nr:BRO family protein [Streptomyces sp. SID10853]NDZ82655.1 DNA-binding protein [Streptomyces sp. SID10853]